MVKTKELYDIKNFKTKHTPDIKSYSEMLLNKAIDLISNNILTGVFSLPYLFNYKPVSIENLPFKDFVLKHNISVEIKDCSKYKKIPEEFGSYNNITKHIILNTLSTQIWLHELSHAADDIIYHNISMGLTLDEIAAETCAICLMIHLDAENISYEYINYHLYSGWSCRVITFLNYDNLCRKRIINTLALILNN